MVNVLRVARAFLIFGTVSVLYILYSPNLLDIDPQEYLPCYEKYEGPLSPNNLLERSEVLFENVLVKPECLAYKDGKIYTSLGDGRIVILKNDQVFDTLIDLTNVNKAPSRALGIRFHKGDLYIADALQGLFKLDIKSGALQKLVPITEPIEGTKMGFPDDLDIDDQGMIYFSDLSTKWDFPSVMYGLLEQPSDGRVLTYDTKTGKCGVLLTDLTTPNGIQVTHDKKAILIAETMARRVLKYHLQGPRKGKTDVFARLPGEPDNIRPSLRGGYWVALALSSNATKPHSTHSWAYYPKIRKIIARLSHMTATTLSYLKLFIPLPILDDWEATLKHGFHLLSLWNKELPTIVELDAGGNIIRSLQSNKPRFSFMTHALEVEGHLYLGTFVYDYIVKVKL